MAGKFFKASGRWESSHDQTNVIPAQAGIQRFEFNVILAQAGIQRHWVPACAGMTASSFLPLAEVPNRSGSAETGVFELSGDRLTANSVTV